MDHSAIYLICAAFAVHRTANSLDTFLKSNVKSRILREYSLSSYTESQKADLSHKKVYVPVDFSLFENCVIPTIFSGALLTWNCMIAFIILTVIIAVVAVLKISVSSVSAMANRPKSYTDLKGLMKQAVAKSVLDNDISADSGPSVTLFTKIFNIVLENAYIRVRSLVHLSATAALSTSVLIMSCVFLLSVFRSRALKTKAIVYGQDGKTYVHRRTIMLGTRAILWVTLVAHAVPILSPFFIRA